jgi:hypothetical protein
LNFFVLKFNPSPRVSETSAEFFTIEPSTSGIAPKCSACQQFTGSIPIIPPIRIEIEIEGRGIGDIVFGPGRHILVSGKFKRGFEKYGLKGISRFESLSEVVVKNKRKAPGLLEFYLISIGHGARLDVIRSGLEEQPKCQVCLIGDVKRVSKIAIEESSWSGEDLFLVRGLPSLVMASEKFRVFCETESIANAVLIPGEEYSFDYYPWEKKGHSQHA